MNFSRDHLSDANDKIYTPWLDQLEAQGLLTPSIVEKANLTWAVSYTHLTLPTNREV